MLFTSTSTRHLGPQYPCLQVVNSSSVSVASSDKQLEARFGSIIHQSHQARLDPTYVVISAQMLKWTDIHSVDITHHESARAHTCVESTTSLASLLYISAIVYPPGPYPYLHISSRFGNVLTLVSPPPSSSPSPPPSFFPVCACRLRCRHTCHETLWLIFSLDLLPTLSWRIALALSPSDVLSHIQKSDLPSSISNIKLSKTTYLEALDKIRVSVHNRLISSSFVQVRRENSSTNSCLRRDSSAQQDIHSTFFHCLLSPRLCAIVAQRRVHWTSFASANSIHRREFSSALENSQVHSPHTNQEQPAVDASRRI